MINNGVDTAKSNTIRADDAAEVDQHDDHNGFCGFDRRCATRIPPTDRSINI